MLRLTLLWLVVSGILVYTWKDWYRGLCGLILLMAVMEHPDMPKTLFGIQGLNPFNLLLANVLAAWALSRREEGLKWDLPVHITALLGIFISIIFVGWIRMMRDTSVLVMYYDESTAGFISDYLINTIKWLVPGLLLFDGCRSDERFKLAVVCTLGVYFLLGLQVIKWMPPQYALDQDALARRSLKVLEHGVGYHRVNLSAMLAGASWAVIASRVLAPPGRRIWIVLMALIMIYAQAMTAGRTGYATWAIVGLTLSVLKWRRLLFVIPAVLALVITFAPGVAGRMTQGFTEDTHDTNKKIEQTQGPSNGQVDAYTVTAGRSFIWPFVIAKINDSIWTGWGRQAMLTTGVAVYIYNTYKETFPHPHNAYLEGLLDNGIIGFIPILCLYLMILFQAIGLFLDRHSNTAMAIGGITTAFMLALMIAGTGSQSFYPVEGWMPMWCAIGLMWRVRVQRAAAAAGMLHPVTAVSAPAYGARFAPGARHAPPSAPATVSAAPAAAAARVRSVAPHFVPRHSASAGATAAPNGAARAAGTAPRFPEPNSAITPARARLTRLPAFSRQAPQAPRATTPGATNDLLLWGTK